MGIKKKCQNCGKEHTNAKFCSNKCVGISQRKLLRKCLKCGAETKNRKFCSSKCSASYNTKGRARSEEAKNKTRITILKSLYPDGNFPVKKICLIKKNIKIIAEEILFEELPVGWKKRVIYYERGNKCEICGFEYTDPITGKGPFEIHHEDGNNQNWSKDNLKIYCLNCHWKTPNYRFRNRKHTARTKEIIKEKRKELKLREASEAILSHKQV